jgi:hypothetical protein
MRGWVAGLTAVRSRWAGGSAQTPDPHHDEARHPKNKVWEYAANPARGGESRQIKLVTVVIAAPYPFNKGGGRFERSGKNEKAEEKGFRNRMESLHIQDFGIVLQEIRRVFAEFEAKKVMDAAVKKAEPGGRSDRAAKAAERTSRNLWRLEKRLKRLQLSRIARVAASEELQLGARHRRRPTDGRRRSEDPGGRALEGPNDIIASVAKATALTEKLGSAMRLRAAQATKRAGPRSGVRKT